MTSFDRISHEMPSAMRDHLKAAAFSNDVLLNLAQCFFPGLQGGSDRLISRKSLSY